MSSVAKKGGSDHIDHQLERLWLSLGRPDAANFGLQLLTRGLNLGFWTPGQDLSGLESEGVFGYTYSPRTLEVGTPFDKTPVKLTRTEGSLFQRLFQLNGQVLTYDEAVSPAYPHQNYPNTRGSLRVLLGRLRTKVDPPKTPLNLSSIQTIRQVGWRFVGSRRGSI